MKKIYLLIGSLITAVNIIAQQKVIPLWENGAPGFEDRKNIPEEAKDYWVRNINNPSLTVFYPPEGKSNGCAVIVAPGGGFRELVFHAEGEQVAEFLNPLGVTVFVLKYRLPNEKGSPYNIQNVQQDAYRAIRLVRNRADEFHIDPRRVGMLGFSAGGAVIMMVAFEKGEGDLNASDPIDRLNGRPDFLMMVYPGGNPPEKIPADTPPAFLICANDDEYKCDDVTFNLLDKFRKAKVPVEAVFFANGKHAFNMGDRSEYIAVRNWPHRMAEWMQDRGFMNSQTFKPDNQKLYDTIVYLDSIFFNAYNTCDMQLQADFYSDNIEFYHDMGGLSTSKQDILDAIKNNVCDKVTRERIKHSIEVYPIANYGAVEMGLHRFHNKVEGSTSEYSKFIIIWQYVNGKWKLARVVSLH